MIQEYSLSGFKDCVLSCRTVNACEFPLKDMFRIVTGIEIEDVTTIWFKHCLNETKLSPFPRLKIFGAVALLC